MVFLFSIKNIRDLKRKHIQVAVSRDLWIKCSNLVAHIMTIR